mgnify:CR=1 FL=1|jgi:hypothetical protein
MACEPGDAGVMIVSSGLFYPQKKDLAEARS